MLCNKTLCYIAHPNLPDAGVDWATMRLLPPCDSVSQSARLPRTVELASGTVSHRDRVVHRSHGPTSSLVELASDSDSQTPRQALDDTRDSDDLPAATSGAARHDSEAAPGQP